MVSETLTARSNQQPPTDQLARSRRWFAFEACRAEHVKELVSTATDADLIGLDIDVSYPGEQTAKGSFDRRRVRLLFWIPYQSTSAHPKPYQ